VRVAPEKLGAELILDNAPHPTAMPPVSYAAESYGAQSGSSIAHTTCIVLYLGPFGIVHVTIEFSGTENELLGRADGTLKFVTDVNPLISALMPTVQSGTVELDGFALREQSLPP